MKHTILLLLFSCVVHRHYCFAQEVSVLSDSAQKEIFRKVEKMKDIDEEIKVIDSLLQTNKLSNPKYLGGIYFERAFIYRLKYANDSASSDSYLNGDKKGNTIINHILSDYKKAIKIYPYYEPKYRYDRMNFLDDLNPDHPIVAEDLAYLKKHGYKEDRIGFVAAGINYMYGKNNWLGSEVSVMGAISPSYVLKNVDTTDGKIKKIDKRNIPIAAAMITFGFNQRLDNRAHEFTFSACRMTAPFFIDITKFGLLQGSDVTRTLWWFYRPEIGIGNSFLSIGYAYNFVFNKSERTNWEKSLVIVKICYPLIKEKKD